MKDMSMIGRTETVSLPGFGVDNVPAKIDTGADSSAIWATDVHEHLGVLMFVLFDETSPHYTGKTISTDEFTVVSVKNSFGHTEKRYKVQLSVKLGGKLIKVNFTLADRSKNQYPILIGNATIRGKFLVDASIHGASRQAGDPRRILILASVLGESTKLLHRRLQESYGTSIEVFASSYQNLVYETQDGHAHITELTSGYDLASFDLVYFRTYIKFASLASAAAEYLAAHRVLFVDREVANHHAVTKLTQYMRLAIHHLPVPDSILASQQYYATHYGRLVEQLGSPFVFKDINAERGMNNHLVRDEQQFTALLAEGQDIQYIAQHYSPNDGDLRVLVFDKKIALLMERKAASGSHLNNTSMGGTPELLPLTSIDAATSGLALRSAAVMNRQIAGVDLLFDTKAKKWYILEVNNSPQISSGTFVDEKIDALSKFLKQYSKK